MNAEILLVEEY